jgi:hypothetical protein
MPPLLCPIGLFRSTSYSFLFSPHFVHLYATSTSSSQPFLFSPCQHDSIFLAFSSFLPSLWLRLLLSHATASSYSSSRVMQSFSWSCKQTFSRQPPYTYLSESKTRDDHVPRYSCSGPIRSTAIVTSRLHCVGQDNGTVSFALYCLPRGRK